LTVGLLPRCWLTTQLLDITKSLLLTIYHSRFTIHHLMEVPVREWQQGEYTISTNNSRLDIPIIHDFISNQSYWGQGRAIEVVQRSLDNSLNFGLYHGRQQVGFARVV